MLLEVSAEQPPQQSHWALPTSYFQGLGPTGRRFCRRVATRMKRTSTRYHTTAVGTDHPRLRTVTTLAEHVVLDLDLNFVQIRHLVFGWRQGNYGKTNGIEAVL